MIGNTRKTGPSLSDFDFSEPAELFGGGSWNKSHKTVAYRRFETSAEAIRYLMEELDETARRPCVLEVNDLRLSHIDVRRLYDRKDYPLKRRPRKETDAT